MSVKPLPASPSSSSSATSSSLLSNNSGISGSALEQDVEDVDEESQKLLADDMNLGQSELKNMFGSEIKDVEKEAVELRKETANTPRTLVQ